MTNKKLIIKGGRVIDPATKLDEPQDILVDGATIEAVDKPGSFSQVTDADVLDASNRVVTPGLIDIHVHLREPGQEWKETILTGSRAAVAGGFTRICCMPNTRPINDSASVTELILEKARQANLARIHPIGAISIESKSEKMAPYLELYEAGCVAFSDDGRPVSHAGLMRRALEYVQLFGTPLTVHEEEKQLSEGFAMHECAYSIMRGLRGMPGAAEDVMIARDIELARLTKGRVHFCHVSTARGVVLIKRAKEDGINVTAEAVPHNFTLDASAVGEFDTNAKMSMPLRDTWDVEGVMQGIADGVIDCIASDHAPHEIDSKNKEFDYATFGIIGLQTTIPLTLAKVRDGKLSLMRALEALTVSPAKAFRLPLPSVRKGGLADLTIIDPEARYHLTPELIQSKAKNTPFLGQKMQGRATHTVVGGRVVYAFA